jgi:hypothetical protein
LLDGGYFEGSGVTTTLELLKEIGKSDLLDKVRFVVIRIQSGAREADSGGSLSMGFSGIKAPIWCLYQTGNARAEEAVRTLHEKAASGGNDLTPEKADSGAQAAGGLDLMEVDFALREQDQQTALPLGWMLSTKAHDEIARQLRLGANEEAFRKIAALLARE